MKTKIYLGILSLVMGLTLGLASCSDDDYVLTLPLFSPTRP